MTKILTPEEIGAKIRAARERLGWSQAKLAEIVGAAQQTIEKIELGKVRRSTYTADLFRILDIPYDHRIFGRFEGKAPWFSVEYQPSEDSLKTLKLRREALGLSVGDLADLLNVSPDDLARIESLDRTGFDDAKIRRLLLGLRRIERQDPIGEPFATPGYYVSALPTSGMPFPYFRMGAEKGIIFEYFAPTPFNFSPSVKGFYCLTLGRWVEGNAVAGQRIYARPNPNLAREELPVPVLAIPSGLMPENVDRVICGLLIQQSESEFVVARTLDDSSPLVLEQGSWSLTQIHMTFSRSTPKSVDS